MRLPINKWECAQEYTKECDQCGKEYVIRSQNDEDPEYYTAVYIQCDCDPKQYVLFMLPVN